MVTPKFLDELSAKFSELAAASPAKDIEKNARAMLGGLFSRMDLVTREEFDVQSDVLARLTQRIAALEARLAELEKRAANP